MRRPMTGALRRRLVRHRMCLYAEFLHARASLMAYAEVRAMRSFHTKWMQLPQHATDCSESCAMIARASWAPTPYVQNDLGFTGTMLATLPHISFSQTRRADFAVFVHPDRPTGDHVVMFLQGGRRHADPMVWSHGSPGVHEMPLSDMQAGFPGHATVYLRSVPERYSKADLRKAKAA